MFLAPSREAVTIQGKLFYSEGDQSWNLIRLKKEVLHEYPQLKDKSASFGYTMIVPKSIEEIKKAIAEFEKVAAVPIILFFRKEKKEE